MREPEGLDPLLEHFAHCVHLCERGDITARELVVDILIKLGRSERFDLAEPTVDLLPNSIRVELEKSVAEILLVGESYKGLFIIGRASDEWWQKTRKGVKLLAEVLKPIIAIRETNARP